MTTKIVPLDEVRRFVENAMTKVGVVRSHAASLADNLVAADYRGHFSHGINRIGMVSRIFICSVINLCFYS
mgnify:CR=1 FL=1